MFYILQEKIQPHGSKANDQVPATEVTAPIKAHQNKSTPKRSPCEEQFHGPDWSGGKWGNGGRGREYGGGQGKRHRVELLDSYLGAY